MLPERRHGRQAHLRRAHIRVSDRHQGIDAIHEPDSLVR